ncbi:fatty acid synthase [Amylocarpus encephaloides]|uniref:Fatty acid synthase n=1 Tax=Amylocarpus encephaloides TaxID=45428 RepID=A0A9P7YKH0_9HELO|nr:fatty acid synthase [Amylocarpus encephaloides]
MFSLSQHTSLPSRASPPTRASNGADTVSGYSHIDISSSDAYLGETVSGVCTPNSASTPSQKLDISHQEFTFFVSIANPLYRKAVCLRDEFLSKLTQTPPSAVSLASRFMEFLLEKIRSPYNAPRDTGNSSTMLGQAFEAFEHDFLQGNEVHAAVAGLGLGSEEGNAILRIYFQAQNVLGRSNGRVPSSLCRAANVGKAVIYAIFGGQGSDRQYFDDIRNVYTTYRPILGDFVGQVSRHLDGLAKDERFRAQYCQGLEVQKWLEHDESQPEHEYLIMAPVSFPLIGLLQLMHYRVACHALGYTPRQMQETLTGVTGHSQGIVIAALVAAATSWKSFDKLSLDALSILQSIGARSQEKFAVSSLDPRLVSDSVNHEEGALSPMLSIQNLPVDEVYRFVAKANKHLPSGEQVEVALINSPTLTVVSGPPLSLYGLNLLLREAKPEGGSQSKIPFGQRKQNLSTRFLPITAPFHSSYLSEVEVLVVEDVKTVILQGNDLRLSVFSTIDGNDLRGRGVCNIVAELVHMITAATLHWEAATNWHDATHIIDFGPGGVSGIKPPVNKNKDCSRARIILATRQDGNDRDVGYKPELFNSELPPRLYIESWRQKYQPRLRHNSSGQALLDTKFSRLLGLPPVMVAGMTPTTVSWEFVAATMNAGYHIELALGGYQNATTLTSVIDNIVKSVPSGRGITCNIIYAAPRAVGWQIPLLTELRAKGVPIHGLTIGAGVPSADVITGYIKSMKLKHISLKPGSIEAIHQVIRIAREHPSFPIILQWTGGRGGGHHSYEDFHQPILQTYNQLRSCRNIILVAGSGFGGWQDSLPYMSGTWSEKYGQKSMPFDGILLGSRVMVAKEARTSLGAKRAIVDAPGVDDSRWEETYKGEAGGVMTVISEMGEPIHKLATRGVKLWAELDKTVFKLERSKRVAWLRHKKSYLIPRLNSDFAKPWFGKNSDGDAVELGEMTYSDVAFRLISLMYVSKESRWVDTTWQTFLYDFMLLVQSRTQSSSEKSAPFFTKVDDLSDPEAAVTKFFNMNFRIAEQLLLYQDSQEFVMMCKRAGQKPVPFIPVLDEDFETLFKKDSLWQSEDLEAVIDQDVGRVCVLQGPVAVQWSKVVDEPIGEILTNIHNAYIEKLPTDVFTDTERSNALDIDYFGNLYDNSIGASLPDGITASERENGTLYQVEKGKSIDAYQWLSLLGGEHNNWRQSFFRTSTVLQDKTIDENPVRRLFKPSPQTSVLVTDAENSRNTTVSLLGGSSKDKSEQLKLIEVRLEQENVVVMEIFEHRNALGNPTGLVLRFKYDTESVYAPIHEIMHDRDYRIKEFYHRVWFAEELPRIAASVNDQFDGGTFTADGDSIAKFTRCVGNQHDDFSTRLGKKLSAPLDFAIVVAWKALMRPLFAGGIRGDLLKLVHLSNEFRMVPGATVIQEGDQLQSKSHITSIINEIGGKKVEVQAQIFRDDNTIIEITSRFLYRGVFDDFENTFSRIKEHEVEVCLQTPREVAILKSKSWFHLHDSTFNLLGQKLVFKLDFSYAYEGTATFSSVKATGCMVLKTPTKDSVPIASIEYETISSRGNPVMEFLGRYGVSLEPRRMFKIPVPAETDMSSIKMPIFNDGYGIQSGDFNPIHVSQTFSTFAKLPGTITHGMYTSARARGIAEQDACASRTKNFRSWKCSFTSMVLPGDNIQVGISHIGMVGGRKIMKVEAINTNTQAVVLNGEAEIEPEDTAYFFTGQGSQQKGMGMDLYASSAAARRVWDYADKHYNENYGFKITDIVKNDPKEMTVFFGGPSGRHIRKVYMSMKYEHVGADGIARLESIFKDIDEETESHTYRSATGLLSSTEFTQPALALMEMATFFDLQERGLILENSPYAGHSLGEYSGLCAVANIMSIESLTSVVFYRGLTMQVAVERDELGRSNFGMCAVDPSRLTKGFDEASLKLVVQRISLEAGWLLEIVNYNIANLQYVCAGELRGLECLSNVLNVIKDRNIVVDPNGKSELQLGAITDQEILKISGRSTPIKALTRGRATIPLKGIDVPFHSSFLKPGIGSFRNVLHRHIHADTLDVTKLSGRYIPNLTAKPFEVNEETFTEVARLTGSQRLKTVADNWRAFAQGEKSFTEVS